MLRFSGGDPRVWVVGGRSPPTLTRLSLKRRRFSEARDSPTVPSSAGVQLDEQRISEGPIMSPARAVVCLRTRGHGGKPPAAQLPLSQLEYCRFGLWLTRQRVVFLHAGNTQRHDSFRSVGTPKPPIPRASEDVTFTMGQLL